MYTTANNQELYFQKIGQGKELVILHGWAQDVSSFWQIAEKLQHDCTVYLIDLPGFGRSELPKRPFTVEDYADTIADFIKQKCHQPIVLGHSVGGRIGIKLAAKYPDMLDKLILEDSAGIKPKRDLAKFFIYPLAKLFHYAMPNAFNLKSKIRYRFYKSLESDYINAGPLKETLTNILKEDLIPDLPRITTETLLLWGENDPNLESSPANGKRMYRLIKNSRIEYLENCGHFPHLENSERFAYFVRDFCS